MFYGRICILLCLALSGALAVEVDLRPEVEFCRLQMQRLPEGIQPIHYELLVNPDISTNKYQAHVKIDLKVNDCSEADPSTCDRRRIILNAKPSNFKVDQVLLNGNKISKICLDKATGFMQLTLSDEIQADGANRLEFKISGNMQESDGLYLSPYVDSNGTRKYAVATHFPQVSASSVFPCFDEPSFKATFDVILEHDADLTALGNMEEVKRGPVDGTDGKRVRTYFATTPIMSIYSVAFVIGEFDRVEKLIDNGNMKIAIQTPPGLANQTRGYLDVVEKCYLGLKDWFQVEQPIRKIDLVALENHQYSETSESWGLISFNSFNLIPNGNPIPDQQMFVPEAICHEISNAWLSNLVTIKWWNDMWMSEGLASYVASQMAQKLYSDEDYDSYYLTEFMFFTLASDSLHPIPVRPHKNQSTRKILDPRALFSPKGHAIHRMLASYIGHEKYRQAIQRYVSSHQYSNTDKQDLIDALNDVTELNVTQFFNDWLEQTAHPLLHVKLVQGQQEIMVRQESIISSYTGSKSWLIPIKMLVGDNNGKIDTIMFVLQSNEEMKTVPLPEWFSVEAGHWIKLNANFEGFYRVSYSDQLMNALKGPFKSGILSPADRISLIDGLSFSFMKRSIDKYQLVNYLSWFDNEENPAVISVLVELIRMINSRDQVVGQFRESVEKVLLRNYARWNGFAKLSPGQQKLAVMAREQTILLLQTLGNQLVLRDGLKEFNSHKDNLDELDRQVVVPVLRIAIVEGHSEQVTKACSYMRSFQSDSVSAKLFSHVLQYEESRIKEYCYKGEEFYIRRHRIDQRRPLEH